MATIPALAEVREWIDVAQGQFSDAQLSGVLEAERLNQASVCRVPFDTDAYPDDLAQAFLRRCARAVSLRGIALGVSGGSASGAANSPKIGLDGEIRRYEAPYRRRSVG